MIKRPAPTGTWLDKYIGLVPDEVLLDGFKRQTQQTLSLLSGLSDDVIQFRYAEGKWNLKEILIHIIDTERLFGFRALAFARGEKQALPGYDENIYVKNSFVNDRDWRSLIEEYIVVRTATVATFASFAEEVLENKGIANNMEMSVAALCYATLGHEMHHIEVIKSKYLSAFVHHTAN